MQSLPLWRKHQLHGERTGERQRVESTYVQPCTLCRATPYASVSLDSSHSQAPSMVAASRTRIPTPEFLHRPRRTHAARHPVVPGQPAACKEGMPSADAKTASLQTRTLSQAASRSVRGTPTAGWASSAGGSLILTALTPFPKPVSLANMDCYSLSLVVKVQVQSMCKEA